MRTALLLLLAAAAQAQTVLGRWTTHDDGDGKPRSVVRIEAGPTGVEGRILEVFRRPGETDPDPVCDTCPGERKGARILGLRILTGLRQEGAVWTGGEILDPDNGRTYRVRLTPSADGSTLEVRGFIGIALLGRTQVWRRAQ